MSTTNKKQTELGGFVKNTQTGQYEMLFSSEIGSEMLVRNRTREKADLRNCLGGKPVYDIEDILVKRRQTVISYTDWEEIPEQPQKSAVNQ